jgi:hemoglobin
MSSARYTLARWTLAIIAFVTVDARATTAVSDSLYARLGGNDVVAAFIADTIDRTASDPILGRSFDKVDLERVKRSLVEQICSLTGGGCVYSGDSMTDVHAGMDLKESDLYGLVEILRDAMVRHGIGLRERNELLAILAPMKRDVVTR